MDSCPWLPRTVSLSGAASRGFDEALASAPDLALPLVFFFTFFGAMVANWHEGGQNWTSNNNEENMTWQLAQQLTNTWKNVKLHKSLLEQNQLDEHMFMSSWFQPCFACKNKIEAKLSLDISGRPRMLEGFWCCLSRGSNACLQCWEATFQNPLRISGRPRILRGKMFRICFFHAKSAWTCSPQMFGSIADVFWFPRWILSCFEAVPELWEGTLKKFTLMFSRMLSGVEDAWTLRGQNWR